MISRKGVSRFCEALALLRDQIRKTREAQYFARFIVP